MVVCVIAFSARVMEHYLGVRPSYSYRRVSMLLKWQVLCWLQFADFLHFPERQYKRDFIYNFQSVTETIEWRLNLWWITSFTFQGLKYVKVDNFCWDYLIIDFVYKRLILSQTFIKSNNNKFQEHHVFQFRPESGLLSLTNPG